MLSRILQPQLEKSLDSSKVTIITGSRRVGKTTLLQQIQTWCQRQQKSTSWYDFTDPATRDLWQPYSQAYLEKLFQQLGFTPEQRGIIFFDEIQKFPQCGEMLKLIYDHFPYIKVYASGSSSFLLLEHIGDSLTGRKELYQLLPLTGSEILKIKVDDYWKFEPILPLKDQLKTLISEMAVYGSYPEVYSTTEINQKGRLLKEMADSILFKDIFELGGIHKPRVLVELARLLAYQIGSLVNPNELASILNIARQTVLDYIQMLERFYIIFRLEPLSSNQRDEIGTKFKVYFYDLGVRNALIGDLSPWPSRQDKGMLWENLVAVSLKKRLNYQNQLAQMFFWRNYEGAEVDIVIKSGQKIQAFEAKLKNKGKITTSFTKRFPVSKGLLISPEAPEIVL